MFAVLTETDLTQVIFLAGFKVQCSHVIEHDTDLAFQYLQRMGKSNLFNLRFEFVA